MDVAPMRAVQVSYCVVGGVDRVRLLERPVALPLGVEHHHPHVGHRIACRRQQQGFAQPQRLRSIGVVGADVAALVVGRLGHHGFSIQYLSGDGSGDRGLCARGDRRGRGGGTRRDLAALHTSTARTRGAAPPGRHQQHAALGWSGGRQAGLADRQHPPQGRAGRGRPVVDRGSRRLGGGGTPGPGAAGAERQGGDRVLRHRGVDGAQRAHRRPRVGQADRQSRQAGPPARQEALGSCREKPG